MDVDVVSRAKAVLVDVTPGPWVEDPRADPTDVVEVANARFIAAARDLVPELVDALELQRDRVRQLVAEVERLRGELPVELDEDFGWIDRDGNFWSYDDINTWQWWIRPPGCDSAAAIPLAKHGPFVRGCWDYDRNGPVAL